jgi:hypothetical protein
VIQKEQQCFEALHHNFYGTERFMHFTFHAAATCCGTIMVSVICLGSITVCVTCLGSWIVVVSCLAWIEEKYVRTLRVGLKNRAGHPGPHLSIFHDGVCDLPRLHDCGRDLLGHMDRFGDLLGNHGGCLVLRRTRRRRERERKKGRNKKRCRY